MLAEAKLCRQNGISVYHKNQKRSNNRLCPFRRTLCLFQPDFTLLAGADADHLRNGDQEDLAVADFAGARGVGDGIGDVSRLLISDDDLDLDLLQQVDRVLRAAIVLCKALLLTGAAHLGNGHALDADVGQRGLDVFEFLRTDQRFYFDHARFSLQPPSAGYRDLSPVVWERTGAAYLPEPRWILRRSPFKSSSSSHQVRRRVGFIVFGVRWAGESTYPL